MCIRDRRVPVSSALRLTLQDLGRVGDLLTRQRDCLVNLLRLLTYASNDEALDDTNSTLSIKLRPLSRDVTSLSEYANFLSSNVNFMLDAVLAVSYTHLDVYKRQTVFWTSG